MQKGKKVWLVLISVALVLGLMPLPAFAEASFVASGGELSPAVSAAGSSYNNNPASILDGKDTKGAYAVLYDDGEMLLQRGNVNKKPGQKVIAVYTGFEAGHSANDPTGYLEDGVIHELWNSSEKAKRGLILSVRAVDTVALSEDSDFHECRNLVTADLSKADVSKLSRFHGFFVSCRSLESVNLSGWDTSHATSMSCMFQFCVSLAELDLSSFNTANVVDMSWMFDGCELLENLNISSFKTSKLEDSSCMFTGCSSLARVSVGDGYAGNFAFPQQDALNIPGADGRWYNGANQGYNCDAIPAFKAATYSARPSDWVKDRSAELTGDDDVRGYKVVYDDGTLVVQMGNKRDEAMLAKGRAVINIVPFDVTGDAWNLECGYNNVIRRVEIRDKFKAPTSMQSWFSGWKKLTYIGFSNLDTSATTDMSDLFSDCRSLRSLGVESFDCSSAVTMAGMFASSPIAASLDFSRFNTRNVKDMSVMFAGARVSKLNLTRFDTSHVTDMSSMFVGAALRELNISGWKTPALTTMNEMFNSCESLKEIDLSSFDVSRIQSCSGLFNRCFSLERVNLSGWNTSRVTDMSFMFYDCSSLRAINLSRFNTSAVTSMGSMFCGCKSLTTLDLKSFDTSRVKDMSCMFMDCTSLANLDISSFRGGELENLRFAFCRCRALSSVDLSKMSTPKLKDVYNLFERCESLTKVDISGITLTDDTSDISCLFWGCSSLKSVNLSGFDTSKVKDMSNLFCDCSSLEYLDLSHLATGNVTDMHCFFEGCSSLKSVDLSKFKTSRVTTMAMMFFGCSSLKKLDLTSFDTRNVKNIAGMFHGCTSLESVDLAGFDTSDLSQYVYTEEERAELGMSSLGAQSVASDLPNSTTPDSRSAHSALSAQASKTCSDIFKGCKNLKKVTVGKKFAFKHSTLFLPAQSAKTMAGANGKWYTASGAGYVPAKVPSNKASTYYAIAPIKAAKVTGVKNLAWTGKARTQNPVVKIGSTKLKKGKDYKVSYKNNVKVGTATMTITGIGKRTGSKSVKFKIVKAANTLKVSGKTAAAKYSKKKASVVKASKAYKFSNKGKGKLTYARIAKGSSKWLPKVNSKTGAITVKKGAPKGGTQKIKVKVTAKGNGNYKVRSKTVIVKVKVK